MSHQGPQAARTESRVDNRGATFSNAGHVYNAPITHQTIIRDSKRAVTYEVDHEDVSAMEWWSKTTFRLLGERRIKLTIIVNGLLGGGSVALSATDVLPWDLRTYAVYAAFGFLLVAGAFWMGLRFRLDSRCVKCNTFYAMKETGQPIEREVVVKGGVRRTTTRMYECSSCSAVMPSKTTEFIPDEPEED